MEASYFRINRFLAPLVVLIGLTGCGMGTYINRMDAQQKRVQEFDEINALLDDPIDMPKIENPLTKEEKPAWPFDVFLRLPRGYSTRPKEDPPNFGPKFKTFPFYRYSGTDPDYNIFVFAVLGGGAKDDKDPERFPPQYLRSYLKTSIEVYYQKTHKVNLGLSDKVKEQMETVKRFTSYADDAKPMSYTTYDYTDAFGAKTKDHTVFRVYLYEEDGKQVGIVEQRPLRAVQDDIDKAFRKAVQASLRTLDVSADAVSRRAQFRKAR